MIFMIDARIFIPPSNTSRMLVLNLIERQNFYSRFMRKTFYFYDVIISKKNAQFYVIFNIGEYFQPPYLTFNL